MRFRVPMLLLRVAALVGLGVSAAMHVDYQRPASALCQVGSGCDQVRASHFSHVSGIPVPVLGIAGFSLLIAASLIRHRKARLATLVIALGGAVAAILLLAIQAFAIHAFCKLCVIVDVSAIFAGAAAFLDNRRGAALRREPVWQWVGAMALWVILPVAWAKSRPPPPAPTEISSLWKAGKINVVEFADFECPYCRQLHPTLAEVMRSYEGKVHFARLNMPLPSHRQALDAARAYCCADDVGRGDAMADALFSADDIGPSGCERIAAALAMDLSAFRACVASGPTEQRIESDVRRFKAAGLRGLPAVFVGNRLLVGMQPVERLREAFAESSSDGSLGPLPAFPFWLLACLGVIAGALALALPTYAFLRAEG
jgi:uncharacterized membrane protein/predicted DsbA family dithiol-disulfide isomerase